MAHARQLTLADVEQAAQILRNGGVIAYPTETVYGLGCDPRNHEAVARIQQLKKRDPGKTAMLLVASSIEQVEKIAILYGAARIIAEKYWPGPLTLLLSLREDVTLHTGVFAEGGVAVRVSSHPFVRALTNVFDFPIVSTSANISGEPGGRSAELIMELFGEALDAIIDVGLLPEQKPSTIARVHEDGRIDILREGAIRL
jgi:L-threonylcarbamoyladenylate synthase